MRPKRRHAGEPQPTERKAHRRMMQALFCSGERAAALHAYEQCRAILDTELNAEPSTETQAFGSAYPPPVTARSQRSPTSGQI